MRGLAPHNVDTSQWAVLIEGILKPNHAVPQHLQCEFSE